MGVPFQQTPEDVPQITSCGGMRRVNIPLESLNLAEQPDCEEGPPDDVRQAAEFLGRLLAYGTQSRSVATMGKRFWAMCYVLRPDLLDGQTLEDFGAQDNKTRQSIEHYIREFKMTFGYGTNS